MSLAFFSPYGSFSPESSMLYAAANVINYYGMEVAQLRCNGCLSLCLRDQQFQWSRDLTSCFGCMQEQHQIAEWGKFEINDLSPFVEPMIVAETRNLLSTCLDAELKDFEYQGLPMFPVAAAIFKKRFNTDKIDPGHSQHTSFIRRVYMSIIRAHQAWLTYMEQKKPSIFLSVALDDFFVMSALLACSSFEVPAYAFSFDQSEQCINVTAIHDGRQLQLPYFFSDISTVRSNCTSWPSELMEEVTKLLGFFKLDYLLEVEAVQKAG